MRIDEGRVFTLISPASDCRDKPCLLSSASTLRHLIWSLVAPLYVLGGILPAHSHGELQIQLAFSSLYILKLAHCSPPPAPPNTHIHAF